MYGRPYEPQRGADNIKSFFTRGGTPLTFTVIALHIVVFFLIWGAPALNLSQWLAFTTQDGLVKFWSLLTWPLASASDPLSLLFSLGWFYTFSSSLERAWGPRLYAPFLGVMAVLTAVGLWLGSLFLGPGMVAGLWVLSGPLAVAWALVNRNEQIGLFFLPVPAPIIGLLGAVMVWFHAGAAYGKPLLGVFALAGCAAAYWYTQNRFSFGGYSARRADSPFDGLRPDRRERRDPSPDTAVRFANFDPESGDRKRGFDPMRWWRERQERKRLENILRRSGFTDDERK